MGRKLRRVPLDFDFPIDGTDPWPGFINPHNVAEECTACGGNGFSEPANHWKNKWYGHTTFSPLDTGNRPYDPTDPFILDIVRPKVERDPYCLSFHNASSYEVATLRESYRMCAIWNACWKYHLSQEDVQALFDADHRYGFTEVPSAVEFNRTMLSRKDEPKIGIVLEARMARIGQPYVCPNCQGKCVIWPSEEARQRYDEWEPEGPPVGEGWQVWETVSEGSPVSPVFATSGELVDWLVGEGYTRAAAEKFIESQWAPSFSMGPGGSYDDINALDMPR